MNRPNASMVTKEGVDNFIPTEEEKLEILVDLLKGAYTVEAFKADYQESLQLSSFTNII